MPSGKSTSYGSYDTTSSGTNSQGNHYCSRDYGSSSSNTNPNSYHYSNTDSSYYYSNPNGSTYYNSGTGYANYDNGKAEVTLKAAAPKPPNKGSAFSFRSCD